MQVDRLADGLWRWTAPHPAWSHRPGDLAGGWDRDVACVYHEAADGIVLIDPLVPEGTEGERFWRHLDQDVERVGLPPTVVISLAWHGRSSDQVRARYVGTRVLSVSHAASCHVDEVLEDGQVLPGGCRVTLAGASLDGRMAIIQCACHGMLWLSDLLIDDHAGGLAHPPAAWFESEADQRWLQDGLSRLMPRLTELPIAHLLPAHGPVISTSVRAALQAALDRPLS